MDYEELKFDYEEEIEESQQENEDDLSPQSLQSISQVLVNSTDWTTETILNQLQRGNIQLNPKFQRRDAWTRERKSRFIESIFLGLPIPQLVLAELKGKRGKYIVIDGKQRLLSLMQFAAPNEEIKAIQLKGLEIRKEMNGHTLLTLEKEPEFLDDIVAFQNHTIRTVVVRNWPDEDFLYLLFLRLNTGSVKLSPQELRQALHPGPFIDFVDDFSGQSQPLRRILKIKEKQDFRMRDVELLIRFYAFRNFLADYNGNLKVFLDTTCKQLNVLWDTEEEKIKQQANELEKAIIVTENIFANDAFKKWNGDKFEVKLNRAIFDVMIYYFCIDEIADAAKKTPDILIDKFKMACEIPEFKGSIETTTKSIQSTFTRFDIWARVLKDSLNIAVPTPAIIDDRIIIKYEG